MKCFARTDRNSGSSKSQNVYRYAELEVMIFGCLFQFDYCRSSYSTSALYARSQKKKTYPPSMDHRATRSENRK